ncbi:hypothetical protein E6C27_scaffold529G00010 [Cucumis melo var. makuwa]|uniref:Uncharacterized protein n=1 Tax=Cucumis melo var. makuwa TaxID=1194695 RepID=A0A5A7TGH7_CUCMM|nr:hypothetical protein E6C27_scaffold529G00010 [Cucumis melo var. makuwa]
MGLWAVKRRKVGDEVVVANGFRGENCCSCGGGDGVKGESATRSCLDMSDINLGMVSSFFKGDSAEIL